MSGVVYPPDRNDRLVARLEAVNRTRALTMRESVMLERALARIANRDSHRRRPASKRMPRWAPEQEMAAKRAVEDGMSFAAAGALVGRSAAAVQDKVYRGWRFA